MPLPVALRLAQASVYWNVHNIDPPTHAHTSHATAVPSSPHKGFLMSLFDMTTLLWVVWITQSMWWALIYKKSTESWERVYHGITWSAGLIVALIPASKSGCVPDSAVWCSTASTDWGRPAVPNVLATTGAGRMRWMRSSEGGAGACVPDSR